MHKKFNHEDIEKKWQDAWKESGIYNAGTRDTSKEKEYVLVEWPYPSGNLHIGHWFAFAVVDMYVRVRRMQGKQVLFPMGFDAFGLPAENAAIKRKLDPKAWTESNIVYMREQLESMGNAFSWDKTTSSTDPEYYAWTQWIFTKLFENNIAFRGDATVNWCPHCNTVIANEQVASDNTCERCDTTIEKRDMKQWMLRITQYADRLVDNLDTLDWPEHIKESQRQWIGRSKGAEINFTLSTGDDVKVFTTRPDTLYGATYMVLAPEHELVLKNKERISNWGAVEAYVKEASQKDEIQRTKAEKEKTGVRLEGITATNPATRKEIPVFIADYVLKGYGTGAIMAVPAHDERDYEFGKYVATRTTVVVPNSPSEISNSNIYPAFAHNENISHEEWQKREYDLILKGERVYTGNGTIINSGEFDGMDSEEAKIAITEKVGGKMTSTYRLRDWSIGRQRYWGVPIPIVYDPEGKPHAIGKEHLPWHLPTDVDFTPTGEPPLAKSAELRERVTRIFGEGWTPEVETMDTFVDSSWYFFRYLDAHNSDSLSSPEAQKEWMPIDIYFGGSEHNTMHLLYSRFFTKVLYDLGLSIVDEPYKRRINRGLVLGPDGNKMSKSKGNVIDPDEQVKRLGADTVRMYLAFMGPYGEMANYPWDMGGIVGQRRFLERVYGLDEHIVEDEPIETTKLVHKTIDKVTRDIEVFKFNTAISSLMVFLNHAEKVCLSKTTYDLFLTLLAPFAPHMAEELWHKRGKSQSIHAESWPVANPAYVQDDTVTISVQVGGKLKGTLLVPRDADGATVMNILRSDSVLVTKVPSEPCRIVYVPNRILNLVS